MTALSQPSVFRVTATPAASEPLRAITAPATAAAVFAGMVFALSPVTVVLGALLAAVIWWASRGLSGRERRWTLTLLVSAVWLRAAAVGAMAMTADPRQASFRSIFGDGQYALQRSQWIRNALLGIPMSELQAAEAFHHYGRSIYYYPLAWLQVVFGPAPYALHLTSVVWYLAAAIALYRLARSSYGSVVAFAGLALILCLPTLLLWSIAPLKESLYFAMASLAVVSAARVVRARRWTTAALAAVVTAVAVAGAATVRTGGLAIILGGLVGGLLIAAAVAHRRLVFAAIVCLPMVAGLALVQPRVQDAILGQIRHGAVIHVGFVTSPGANYRLLAPDFYTRKRDPDTLTRREAIAYGAAALREFVLMPRPWAATSLNDIAMVPQQLIWYALVIFAVPGAVAGLRRDALVTGLLAATTLMGVAAVAPSSGNIGTLIRHRDMIVPFLVWLGALGAAATVRSCLSLVRREGK